VRTDFLAVGNWRVIGHDTARLLATRGAQLVHSAPSVGIRDWSDLRIAVGAGVWLAGARPGDVVEIVSDDRAFDAVGDVAASLGITYRRMSYRALMMGAAAREPAPPVEEAAPAESRGGRGRRRGRRRGWRDRPPVRPTPPPAPVPQVVAAPEPVEVGSANGAAAAPSGEPHTAPHDEIVGIAQELIARSASGSVTIDALANALKSRGFRRPPGSPRLITRLRRIRELEISRNGLITLVDGRANGAAPSQEPVHGEDVARGEDVAEVEVPEAADPPPPQIEPPAPLPEDEDEDDNIGNRLDSPLPTVAPLPGAQRQRSHRGGRHRRRGGGGQRRGQHSGG
jgi:hypothetical protein